MMSQLVGAMEKLKEPQPGEPWGGCWCPAEGSPEPRMAHFPLQQETPQKGSQEGQRNNRQKSRNPSRQLSRIHKHLSYRKLEKALTTGHRTEASSSGHCG